MSCTLGSLLPLLLLSVPAPAATWVVDDDGGHGVLPDIQVAVLAAAPEDVVLVMPGTYTAFFLDKELSIIGPAGGPRPVVKGWSSVVGAPAVTLAGLHIHRLILEDVPGAARIDDCVLGLFDFHASTVESAVLEVLACGQLLVTRCVLDGSHVAGGSGAVGAASLGGTRAVFVGCTLRSGPAPAADFGECGIGGHPATVLLGGAAQFVGCQLAGGDGGLTGCFSWPSDGGSGDGLEAFGAELDLRGDSFLEAGFGPPAWEGEVGEALHLHGGVAVLGGASLGLGGLLNQGAQLVQAPAPEPLLRLHPEASAGPHFVVGSLELWSPAAAPVLLLVSVVPGLAALPGLGDPLWMPFPATAALWLPGGSSWLDYEVRADDLPVGGTITLQALLPGVADALEPAKAAASNPDQFVVRA